MLDRSLTVFVAVSLALLVWLHARSREQETLENVAVPVQVVLGEEQQDAYAVETAEPAHVVVSFTGLPARMSELRAALQRGDLRICLPLTVPERTPQLKVFPETVRVSAGDVPTPPGVKAVLTEGRDTVRLTVHRLVQKRLPVRFDYSLESHTGPVVVEPSSVLVRGPQDLLDRTPALPTQPWVLAGRGDDYPRATRVPLVQEIEGRPVRTQPASVLVRIPSQQQKVYELHDVPVRFLTPPGFPFHAQFLDHTAGKLSLRVQGPAREEPPRAQVFIDLTSAEFAPRVYSGRPIVQLPRDYTLAQEPPRDIPFELAPAAP